MKRIFEAPQITVICFDDNDILTASNNPPLKGVEKDEGSIIDY